MRVNRLNSVQKAKQPKDKALNFQIEVGYVFHDRNNTTVSLAEKVMFPQRTQLLILYLLCLVIDLIAAIFDPRPCK